MPLLEDVLSTRGREGFTEAEVLPDLLPSTNCGEHGPTTVPLSGALLVANPILFVRDKEIGVDRPRRKVVQRSNLMPQLGPAAVEEYG
jgi:hypothetical protein